MTIDGLDVETFFGGNTPDWASPVRQIAQFTNFVLLSEEVSSSTACLRVIDSVILVCIFTMLIFNL